MAFHNCLTKPSILSWIHEETKLNCGIKLPSCLVNNYLAKELYIIERDSKQKFMLPNDVKLIINVIDKLDTDFVGAKNKSISSVANTIIKLHIFLNMQFYYGVCYGGN